MSDRTRELRAGIFTDSYLPVADGVAVTAHNYALWLGRQPGGAVVVAPRSPSYVDRQEYPVIRYASVPLPGRPPYRLGLPGLDTGLRKALDKREFSLVHSHSPFSTGRVAARIAKERGLPLIATFHSKYRDDFSRAIRAKAIVDDQIRRIADYYRAADFVWLPQAGMAAILREYGYEGPYEVMENGIDLEAPLDLGPRREQGAVLLGMPEGLLVGLYVGQHILEKNLEFLLRCLPPIMRAVPEFRMVFVGSGYAKARLRRLASELGVADRTLFHEPVADRETLASIYSRGDLLLFPSLYDNAPLVLREAAAHRTPALLIELSTAASVVEDGRNGFLAPHDLEGYAARAMELLRDPRALESAGAGAQASLCRPWRDVLRQVRSRYLEILGRWRR